MKCSQCSYGEYHGLVPEGSPEYAVSTVYFWCPLREHHDQYRDQCIHFKFGKCKYFDKFGKEVNI